LTFQQVISGDDDFAVHLNGARQLRSIRKRWKIVSGQTRQLNEISTFLTLLARTTAIKTPSVELQYGENGASSGDDLVEQSNTCYEYMYGVTPMIATAIQETCRLAEILAQYGDVHDIPDPLLQACEELGERLQSWHLASERPAPIPAGDDEMLAIFTHHANAWHCAALLYYYRRIQNCHAADLVREVDLIADHMHAVEDTKVRSKSECIRRTAPITWPMFVASCDAVGASRDRCRKWWERVERYGISNISRQWEVVQQIWEKMEEIRLNGNDTTSWMDAFVSLDIKLLPV
jgi:hypothetical protein